jgi:hypothetical protein
VGKCCADYAICSTRKIGTLSLATAVAQSVYFACGLKAAEIVCFILFYDYYDDDDNDDKNSNNNLTDFFIYLHSY